MPKIHLQCPHCKSTEGFTRKHKAVVIEEFSFNNVSNGLKKWEVDRALLDVVYGTVESGDSFKTVTCLTCHRGFRFDVMDQMEAAHIIENDKLVASKTNSLPQSS